MLTQVPLARLVGDYVENEYENEQATAGDGDEVTIFLWVASSSHVNMTLN